MAKVLIVAEHLDGKLNASTAKCVSCAQTLPDADIDVVVFSADGANLCADVAKLENVSKVIQLDSAANEHALAAILAPQLAEIAAAYSHVFGPSTTFGKDLMPRVAALLGVNQISDIMAVIDSHTFKRPIYAGNAVLTVEAPADKPVVATVRTASFAAVGNGGNASIEAASSSANLPQHTRYVELQSGASDRPDLQTATKVVSGGRALASTENFSIINALADTLNAGRRGLPGSGRCRLRA